MFKTVKECKYQESGTCRWCEYSYYPELFDGGCRLHYERFKETKAKKKACEICGNIFIQTTEYDRVCSVDCAKKIRYVVKEEYFQDHPEKKKHYKNTYEWR